MILAAAAFILKPELRLHTYVFNLNMVKVYLYYCDKYIFLY